MNAEFFRLSLKLWFSPMNHRHRLFVDKPEKHTVRLVINIAVDNEDVVAEFRVPDSDVLLGHVVLRK
jgi:hypothetical protein